MDLILTAELWGTSGNESLLSRSGSLCCLWLPLTRRSGAAGGIPGSSGRRAAAGWVENSALRISWVHLSSSSPRESQPTKQAPSRPQPRTGDGGDALQEVSPSWEWTPRAGLGFAYFNRICDPYSILPPGGSRLVQIGERLSVSASARQPFPAAVLYA